MIGIGLLDQAQWTADGLPMDCRWSSNELSMDFIESQVIIMDDYNRLMRSASKSHPRGFTIITSIDDLDLG